MARLARAAGCRVLAVQRWASDVPDRAGVGYVVDCPSHRAKVALLDGLAWYDAKNDLQLRAFALDIVRRIGTGAGLLARAVHALVRDGVRFLREPKETFQDAYLTLYYGAGDCDDVARLVVALLRILGVRARLALLYRPGLRSSSGERIPTHVSVKALVGGRWRWLETTLAARFGEHPIAAKRRLGAEHRADI